ncbi:TIGR03089 family protein [Rhizocola hellebori]|uniref:TIGR03089 family protein n=1 Tax=Rhizocola hellebori TaxID=1392758 RepID=A0A8J3VK47_9ACTN|nr:TIGR03089 family protein [Rhizocola hellebori]GIH08653.1 TIGR03089 family protein [Rhizocola hellebori]
MSTIASLFASAFAADPTRPMLTWYDEGTGERTELSGATLANWVNKTANLLVDELGLAEGDVAVIQLPAHWQTAAILLACWTVGLSVADEGAGEVSFGLPTATADYAVGLHPFALPVRNLPDGVQDWVLSARAHGDFYGGPPASAAANADLVAAAARRANELGLSRGDRVLVNVDSHDSVTDWLLAPIAAGCSMVLCRNADPATLDRRAATERVTARVG